jgi:hypothetical protein
MQIAECGVRNRRARGVSPLSNRGSALALTAFAVLAPVFANAAEPEFKLETLQGRVVFLGDVLEKKYGISVVPEGKDRTLALQQADSTLVPLVEDVRGRAFRADERLRKMDVTMLVRRYDGIPAVQVIRLFESTKDGPLEIDYWCDVCAIAMVELKPCECCQGETALRRRKAE